MAYISAYLYLFVPLIVNVISFVVFILLLTVYLPSIHLGTFVYVGSVKTTLGEFSMFMYMTMLMCLVLEE